MSGLVLDRVALGHGSGAVLPPTSARAPVATVSVLAVETGERPTVLSLVAAGRMRPDEGVVRFERGADLRRAVALVDTPTVAEPAPGLRLTTVVAEQLALADVRASRAVVHRELERAGLADRAQAPISTLDAADRIRLLGGLAARRPGVRALVVTSPERHGGDPGDWAAELGRLADDGLAVLVVTDALTRTALLGRGALDAATTSDQELP